MPLVDPNLRLPPSVGRDLSFIAVLTMTVFNPACPKMEKLPLELGTANNGKQGIVFHWIPPFS